MANKLSIGIDLGSDTIKIAFAYKNTNGISYGKFDNKSMLTKVAIPALAFYDDVEKKWIFGDELENTQQLSFINVVKIKSLISLLSSVKANDINSNEKNNLYYYSYGHYFPKFYFPSKKRMLENFNEMVNLGMVFEAPLYTPESVCIKFFEYIYSIVSKRIEELEKLLVVKFEDYKIALVHPFDVSSQYIEEFEKIVKNVFGKKPHKVLSSNKALAIFAKQRQVLTDKEDVLVFDMAEEHISVARIGVKDNKIFIDGKDGHNSTAFIGGEDIDRNICEFLYKSVEVRETVGTPSYGQNGHLLEMGVYGKQYLLMKDIKKAKVIFSKKLPENSRFNEGVPIGLNWDLFIQQKLTKSCLRKCIGVENDCGIAKEIYDYIRLELDRPLNYNISKIFMSGGLIETYSLLDYIKNKLVLDKYNVEVKTFDDNCDNCNEFCIQSYEDSVFAPAVGGAIASLINADVKVVLTLSYGTWFYENDYDERVLYLFANRGDDVNKKEFVHTFKISNVGVLKDEELFSTFITEEDLLSNNVNCETYNNYVVIGEPKSLYRENAKKIIDLKTVSGGEKGYIIPMFKGKKIRIVEGSVNFAEGMEVDKDGVAHPIVKNDSDSTIISVCYQDNNVSGVFKIKADEVEFKTNLTNFQTLKG